jgi:GTP 3',8-cyclase
VGTVPVPHVTVPHVTVPHVREANVGSFSGPVPHVREANVGSSPDKIEAAHSMRLSDKFGREITDLRLSVTDRCNYKCVYCRTGNLGAQFPELPLSDYLRMARIFVSLGIRKVRLTGGEPLLRAGLIEFVRCLSQLRTPDSSPLEIAITTNGHLLAEMAEPLREAGLTRVTVSMDGMNEEKFARVARVHNAFASVLAGVRAAKRAGLEPVKVNCVLLRGFNDDQIVPFGEFARDEGVIVRFIEFMPLEEDRVWSPDVVVRMDEIVERLSAVRGLVEVPRKLESETARRFVFEDGVGEIGIVAPVSDPFCHHCSRVRITSDGKIRTCLFSAFEHDLAARMHRGATDEELADFITDVVMTKEERHHIGEEDFVPASRTMVHIGG